jgi:hypothetical protein
MLCQLLGRLLCNEYSGLCDLPQKPWRNDITFYMHIGLGLVSIV